MNSNTGWLTLIVISLASFITTFDHFHECGNHQPSMGFKHHCSTVQAIITIYVLTMGCLMLLGAKIQDIIGRRKKFIIGSVIYGLGALYYITAIISKTYIFNLNLHQIHINIRLFIIKNYFKKNKSHFLII